jgi:hypothetical protein
MSWPDGVPPKAELRESLRRAHPWLDDLRFGPRNVDAGECDRCAAEPRLVQTCGPGAGQLGRRCATADDWCGGHADEAADALAYLHALPQDADDVAWLWWLSTGEVRYGSSARYVPLKYTSGSPSLGPSNASTEPSSNV